MKLALLNYLVASDFGHGVSVDEIAAEYADRAHPDDLTLVTQSWREFQIVVEALDLSHDWIDRAIECARQSQYSYDSELTTLDWSHAAGHATVGYDARAFVLLPDQASAVVGEKAPHIGGCESALNAANARALVEEFGDERVNERAIRYGFGGLGVAVSLAPDEDGSFDSARSIVSTIEGLYDYPVIDDEVWSNVENERMGAHIIDWMRNDLSREVCNVLESMLVEDVDETRIVRAIEDLENDENDDLLDRICYAHLGHYSVDDMVIHKHAAAAAAAVLIERATISDWPDPSGFEAVAATLDRS